MLIKWPLLLIILLAIPAGLAGKPNSSTLEITSETKRFSRGFKGRLEEIVATHHGCMGISLKHLQTGETISINGDEIFPTASTIKMAVMCAVFDALSSPSATRDYYSKTVYDESTSASGSGFIQRFKKDTKLEVKELLHFMMTASDNTGTNMLVEWVGGLDPVNNWLESKGFKSTRMLATIGSRRVWNKELRETWGLGMTTPNEMRELAEMIVKGKAGSTTATDEMLRILGHQYFDGGIASQVPPTVWVGSKSGSVNRSRSDVAIVGSPSGIYILSVYTKDNVNTAWDSSNEAEKRIRNVSRLVWKHFNPKVPFEQPKGAEKL